MIINNKKTNLTNSLEKKEYAPVFSRNIVKVLTVNPQYLPIKIINRKDFGTNKDYLNNELNNNLYKPLTFLQSILQSIDDKCKENKRFTIFNLNDNFAILISLFTVTIVPIFYLYLYILDASNISSLFIFFLSCNMFWLCSIVGLNIYNKNTGNIWPLIKMLLVYFIKNRNGKGFWFKILLIIVSLLSLIGINILGLNIILSSLGITQYGFFIYVLVRLSLLPYIVYINNIVICIIIKYYTKDKTAIDYNIFSANMFTSLTLCRLLTMICFISLGFVARFSYFYLVFEKSSSIDVDINISYENICGLDNTNVEVVDKKYSILDLLMSTTIGKSIIGKTYINVKSNFQAKDLTVIWLEPLQPKGILVNSEVYCKDLITRKTQFYNISSPRLKLELGNKVLYSYKTKGLLPIIFGLYKNRFEIPSITSKEIDLSSFLLDSNNKKIDNYIKNINKYIQVFTSQIDIRLNSFQDLPNTTTKDLIVSTTRAVIGDNLPLPIFSSRLIIRSYRLSDLEAYHTLLNQPEAMEGNNMSPDLTYTKLMLEEELVPSDSEVHLGIFLKKSDGYESDLIGDGGVHNLRIQGEWPELSYRFKKEYWNKGYATEFATAFMQFWWSLPREPTRLQVRPNSVDFQNTPMVTERVYASVKQENKASKRVLEKAGFELFEDIGNDSLTHWRNIKPIIESSEEDIKPIIESSEEVDLKNFDFSAFLGDKINF